jgi:hypothetical protein
MAFNTAWHEITGATPALLFLGREINHPLGLKWELSELDLQLSPSDTKVYWEKALVNLKRARDRVARRYNALRSEAVFSGRRFGPGETPSPEFKGPEAIC